MVDGRFADVTHPGVSLGIKSSHLTYSWPRFLEEDSGRPLDARSLGATVGNDHNEYGTF